MNFNIFLKVFLFVDPYRVHHLQACTICPLDIYGHIYLKNMAMYTRYVWLHILYLYGYMYWIYIYTYIATLTNINGLIYWIYIYIATYVIYTWPSLNRLYGMIVCMIICLKCIWPLCIWPHILYIYIYNVTPIHI